MTYLRCGSGRALKVTHPTEPLSVEALQQRLEQSGHFFGPMLMPWPSCLLPNAWATSHSWPLLSFISMSQFTILPLTIYIKENPHPPPPQIWILETQCVKIELASWMCLHLLLMQLADCGDKRWSRFMRLYGTAGLHERLKPKTLRANQVGPYMVVISPAFLLIILAASTRDKFLSPRICLSLTSSPLILSLRAKLCSNTPLQFNAFVHWN